MTSTAPVRVLYVGGMPRSGSTLITWMIGQFPGHEAVGELFYLWSAGVGRDQVCGCGEPFRSCPFWTEVGERAFGGWDQVDVAHVESLLRRVDKTSAIPRMLTSRLQPSFRRDLEEYADVMTRVYAAAASVAGVDTVVDGSKRPSLAYLLRLSDRIDLRVVHIVRDPRGVAHSWSKKVELPPGAGVRGYLKVRSTRLITRRWITVNALVSGLRRFGVPLLTVRYEDLAAEPRRVLEEVARFAGVTDEDAVAAFVRDDGVHVEPAHMVEGGRVRFSPSPLEVRLDEKWRTEMPERRRRAIETATWVSRRSYGYR
jgi:hypothetical protein